MSEVTRANLTIIVPTYNRPAFLVRLLRYYEACGAPCPIRILDSSSRPASRPAEDPQLDRLLAAAHVAYARYDATTPPLVKISEGLRQVTTPYVVLWADDDFLVPGALEEGVRLLERHRDISVVHGRSSLFGVNAGHVQWVAPYLQRSVTDETASARLQNHLGCYSVMFYSIHRTEALRQNLHRVCEFGLDWHTWGEIALSALAVIQGKAITLPRLYMVREGHEGMWSARTSHARDIDAFDWLTDTAFSRECGSYEIFRDCLVPALVEQDGIDVRQARELVKRAFWPYLVGQMREKWCVQTGRSRLALGTLIRDAARRVPGLRTAWRTAWSLLPGYDRVLALHALLRPSSRYHRDFMPIYRSITAWVNTPATFLEVPKRKGVESESAVVEGRDAE